MDCRSLKSITIPNSVTRIKWHAFEGCESLELITIPESLTDIANDAFRGCEHLTTKTIPSNVTIIGEDTIDGKKDLESIVKLLCVNPKKLQVVVTDVPCFNHYRKNNINIFHVNDYNNSSLKNRYMA